LIHDILRKVYKTDLNVAMQAQDILEMKQITNDHVENLLDAVGDQTELISRQNKIISELIRKVDDQNQILSKQKKIVSKHGEKLEKHSRLHERARKMILQLIDLCDSDEITKLMKFCEKEFEKPDMPIVASDESDPEIERQVLGSGSGSVSLGDDPESIAQFNLRLVSQEKINEDVVPANLKEDTSPEDDEKRTADDWELVAEYEEEILPAENKQEASGD
jgi:hypothetical protein